MGRVKASKIRPALAAGESLENRYSASTALCSSRAICRRIAIRRKPHRPSNAHADLPRPRKLLTRLLHFKQSHNSHRQNRNLEIIRQQPNPRAKRIHLPVHRMSPLRKHQHAISAIHGLAPRKQNSAGSQPRAAAETDSAKKLPAPTAYDHRFC